MNQVEKRALLKLNATSSAPPIARCDHCGCPVRISSCEKQYVYCTNMLCWNHNSRNTVQGLPDWVVIEDD